jgi:hypothetical protein
MKNIIFLLIFGMGAYLLGVASAVMKYQSEFSQLVEICSPYDCTTDTDCEEQEQRKKEVYDKFILKQTYHM